MGLFARKLAERSEFVDALDVDSAVLAEASTINSATNISYLKADFLAAALPEENYDVVVSIASLHHMDLEASLEKMKLLLRPSGKLLILGLYQEKTLADYIYSVISIPLNLVYLQLHRASISKPTMAAPTRSPKSSLKQIKTIADAILSGSRLRRHLLWRYSLVWQKP